MSSIPASAASKIASAAKEGETQELQKESNELEEQHVILAEQSTSTIASVRLFQSITEFVRLVFDW